MNIVTLQDIKSTQKSLAFLYTNKKIEREIKETIPFHCNEKNKILRNIST